jgi:hypothetical protein
MNPDFLQLRSLEGDLKLSHKKENYGLTISTKELILHKPHVNYYFRLEDIISILPYNSKGLKAITFVNKRSSNQETISLSPGSQQYKLHVRTATIHNRSGIFKTGFMDVIIPIHEQILHAINEYGTQTGLISI